MGNTLKSTLVNAIKSDDTEALQRYLDSVDERGRACLATPLNRRRDNALTLAARCDSINALALLLSRGDVCNVNATNGSNETALDVVLKTTVFSHDGYCAKFGRGAKLEKVGLPPAAALLLRHGGAGQYLDRLVLHIMSDKEGDEHCIRQIIESFPHFHHHAHCRISGLLLQTTSWYYQLDNLQLLLEKGVWLDHFWSCPFMPKFQVRDSRKDLAMPTEGDVEGSYHLLPYRADDVLFAMRYFLTLDWREEWHNGDNPLAQYRAGLQLPPDVAVCFVQAANSHEVLCLIVDEILSYLPPNCEGPYLQDYQLLPLLSMAGIVFSQQDITYLELKARLDLTDYKIVASQPRPLKHLCRICVRFSFKNNAVFGVNNLPDLPPRMREYILLR